ncbi:hypothetical protein QBC41DRAFT_380636 [Cercophora samala]|uniref:Actin-like ATPase domain-containing protein n=1 Tax=Cercophora samala TaxID=330535 RepID=A0AA39ZKA7_9PEZI|nr:hypothetical protein QBC41DRAFT_380636 [Cercophora samala]
MSSSGDDSDAESGDNTIIIGIDFGTTFSGVAYTWSNKADQMEVITSWDSDLHFNSDLEKAPTAISLGSKNKVTWGYSIPEDVDQVRWFKLLLIDEDDLPAGVRGSLKIEEARAYLKKHNKTAVEVIGLYLLHLWNHTTQRITETVGRATVNYSKFEVLITLPAIWPPYAQSRMREAARLAGMLGTRVAGPTVLKFISEPEAAALATLSDMQSRCDIQNGDSFVVVDCGGGTVDLISYDMVSVSPAKVKECVKGQGDLCGAVFVDAAFAEILKDKFGDKRWKKLGDESRGRLLHDQWEHGIKSQFDGSKREWKFTMPWECLEKSDLKTGKPIPKIVLTSDDVQRAFDLIVEKITAMVDDQVASVMAKKGNKPKYVILVGGFGRSRYVFTSLKKRLGNDIEVLQSRGASPWTAICRGAVIHGTTLHGYSNFSVDVQGRISRASYGVTCRMPWNDDVHDAAQKYFCEVEQIWKVTGNMKWFLKSGETVTPEKQVKYTYWRFFDSNSERTRRITEKIYTCDSLVSPNVRTDDVTALCTVHWDTTIDITSLPTFTNSLGKVFYKLLYEIEMTVTGGVLDFAVYHKGKRIAGKGVMVDYENA